MIVIVGLGNPGGEYENTRHNAGRVAVELLAKKEDFTDFKFNKKAMALVAKGVCAGKNTILVLPETMMNNSGKSIDGFVKSPRAAKNLVVVHDDLDLPLGTIKMTFGRGSGGHKGVESIMRAIKTKDFVRIRIGISAVGKRNQAKNISSEEKVIKHVIGKWKPGEISVIKKMLEKTVKALQLFAEEDVAAATLFVNTR